MPRGVSRKDHPELYKDKPTTMKVSGRGRGRVKGRVKTGGRGVSTRLNKGWTGEKIAAGGLNFGAFTPIYNLAQIREKLCVGGNVNKELLNRFDGLITMQIDFVREQINSMQSQTETPLASGAVIERQGQQGAAFNPPPPSGGQYQRVQS